VPASVSDIPAIVAQERLWPLRCSMALKLGTQVDGVVATLRERDAAK
jgi:hypothetical protein